MADFSIRQLVGCLNGVPAAQGTVSLVRDFFGYRSVPRDSFARAEDISVRRQAMRLRGLHVHLNLILMGEGYPSNLHQELDKAIAYARRLFGGAGIGIGRIKRFRVPQSEVDGYDEIDNSIEFNTLSLMWSAPDEYAESIDVFVVRSISGADAGGRSPVDGSCDNYGLESGLAIVHNAGEDTLAHEIGHYLGLDHPEDMEEADVDDPMLQAAGAKASSHFSAGQGETLREHCVLRPPCP